MLVELGINPQTVRYVTRLPVDPGRRAGAGGRRSGVAGLTPSGRPGAELKFLIGSRCSKHPSNVYSVRTDDLHDEAKKELYLRFLQGMVMGLEFTKANPRAAAQITYRQLPDLRKTLKPQAASTRCWSSRTPTARATAAVRAGASTTRTVGRAT